MKNNCSKQSIDQLESSGILSEQKQIVLSVFMNTLSADLTARQAACMCFGMTLQSVRSRITELENAGILKKTGVRYEGKQLREVSTWAWTGLTKPVPTERVLEGTCDKCGAHRRHWVERPVDPKQGDFINA